MTVNPRYQYDDSLDEHPHVPMSAVSEDTKRITEFTSKENIYSGLSKFKEDDVLFARITPCTENGKVALVANIPENYEMSFGSSEFAVLSAGDEILPRFLYYLCQAPGLRTRAINQMKGASGRKRVPYSFLREEIEIPIPPIEEQKQIVEILDSIFHEIENIEEVTHREEEIESIFFESALSDAINQIGERETSEWIRISDVCDETKNGGTPKRSEERYWEGEIPWLKSGEVDNNKLYDAEEYITKKGLDQSSAKLFRPDTVLVAMYGDGNTRGRASLLKEEMSANQAVCGLSPNQEQCIPEYLWYCVMSLRAKLRAKSRGGNQANLNQGMIVEEKIPLPPLETQRHVVSKLSRIQDRFDNISSSLDGQRQVLSILPESILHSVLKGETTPVEGEFRSGINDSGQLAIQEFN
ncbi:restriction endonuclease subunit S [Halomicroarcula sp. F13]|uniref:Restriction endonuclease subunit S n=1 Tax=Haloarcula rubra TaxID=2487747 RepID=A0AAW4PYK7_9EURY|nr:restriction endonuclease subunit S [Halomicroarcula rubra]